MCVCVRARACVCVLVVHLSDTIIIKVLCWIIKVLCWIIKALLYNITPRANTEFWTGYEHLSNEPIDWNTGEQVRVLLIVIGADESVD